MASLGIANTQSSELPERDLAFWRFFLRDTGPRDEARAQARSFFDSRKAQAAQDKATGRQPRSVTEVPSDLIFFWRVVGLLRGLCSTLRARVPLLQLLSLRARIAIASLTPPPQRAIARVCAPPPTRLHARLHARLQARLQALLSEAWDDGGVACGVQVCVRARGEVTAEAACGVRGAADPRPLSPETPMPLLEVSTLLPVLAIHALLLRENQGGARGGGDGGGGDGGGGGGFTAKVRGGGGDLGAPSGLTPSLLTPSRLT
eukprot:5090920-Pleurochrysis_carterae.AAC.1